MPLKWPGRAGGKRCRFSGLCEQLKICSRDYLLGIAYGYCIEYGRSLQDSASSNQNDEQEGQEGMLKAQ